MNIPEIIPIDLSGFCDVATGECFVYDTSPGSATEKAPERSEEKDDGPALLTGKRSPQAAL